MKTSQPETQLMNFLTHVIDDGLQRLSIELHDDFLAALRLSLTVDPFAYSPDLFMPFGFSQRELYTLRVLLLRPLAFQLYQELGGPLEQAAFDRRSSFDAYQRRYQRDPWLISLRPRVMLLTPSEWLHLVDAPVSEIPLPEALQA